MMKDEELLQILKDKFPTAAIADRNRIKIKVKPEELHASCQSLLSLGMNYLHTIAATDYPASGEFEVSYIIGSIEEDKRNNVVMLITRVSKSRPVLQTVSDIWAAAKLEEREEWEMLGVMFEGNDGLERLYLPEDWNEIPPLLKEYKLKRWVDEERERHGLIFERIEHEH